MSKIRDLALAVLDTDTGVNGDAYDILRELMLDACDCGDIVDAVKATDDAFYLPADWKKQGSI